MIKTNYSPVLFLMCSTLLWRRSDNVVFALLQGGSDLVTIGDGVECKVRAILQVVDESEGPSTKKEYHLTTVPVGDSLRGQVVDYLGRVLSPDGKLLGSPQVNTQQLGTEARLPLLNRQPDMESREQITEALVTGVKSLDILTPLGRGQALQVSGPKGSGKTQLCLDVILGQQGAGVRCFYAAVGCTSDQLSRTVAQLEEHRAMGYTTVIAAPSDRSLGEQYAAMLTACSMAEAVRDAGGHALVVLNDVSVAVRMWEMITVAMADLGSVALDVLETGANASAEQTAQQDGEEDAMVEYEGMLVSVAAAQRRRFFSSMIQRCAKMHRRLKGGSLTGLFVVPGRPAGSGDLTGELSSRRLEAMKQKVRKYRHLTEEQKEKLLHALEKPEKPASSSVDDTSQDVASEQQSSSLSDIRASQELRTEIVEEFMSIVDGQIVLKRPSEVGMDMKEKDRSKPHAGVHVDPRASLSRIGSRAHPPALVDLAPTIRFDLLQAEDARKFAAAAAQSEARYTKTLHRADIVKAALQQPIRSPCPLEIQVVHLMAIKSGLLDDCEPSQVGERLDRITSMIQNSTLQSVLAEISETKRLTATSQAALEGALADLRTC
jgi:F-type H+-transporting ATPase subunit alpha